MSRRNLPWVFLGLAVVLAVVAVAKSGFDAYEEEPHNPFAHVADAFKIELFETRHLYIPLHQRLGDETSDRQAGFSKFMLLELVAAGLIILIYVPMARRLANGDPPRG